jgi:glutamyl endopeptidase
MKTKEVLTEAMEIDSLESHGITSNEQDSVNETESSFQGISMEIVEAGQDDTEEIVGKKEGLLESVLESGLDQENGSFVLDAWYGSFPEDLPEYETKLKAPETLEVIIGKDDRVRINPTNSYPWRAICSLKIKTKTGKNYIGTGWFVGPRTVITAGHCIYMHNEGGWAKSIEVIPGRNGNQAPYGSTIGTTFRSVKGWTNDKNRDFDYGAIILPSNSSPGSTVGYFGYSTKDDDFLKGCTLNLSGYPGDKDGGSTQWFHTRKAKGVDSRVISYEIDTMGGQSGSPVWFKSGNSRYAVGIHTNGHSSGNSATRIVKAVFDNIKSWKQMGM